MEFFVRLAGRDEIAWLESLEGWLRGEPGMAGRVRLAAAQPQSNEMGVAAQALVVAVGSGGALSVFAASLRGWLSQPRRSDIRVRVEVPGQRIVEIDGDRLRADEIESLLRHALGSGSPQE
jgi:outer membrane biogenesis lipoprotein LolB